ncbi:phospholipase [Actinoplanes sp. NPDC020271]|uniref:phospholipase n=1 Tax=Actinoplanes sp. NPDC020271 TaxID=3363896 RepID=UPI0037A3B2D9
MSRPFAASILSSIMILGLAAPARAATAPDRATVLASFTQPTVTSYNAWNAARRDRAKWASYHFDWGTDYCSVSPDRPFGFDFRLACRRHDFGYGNYKLAGTFSANKKRLDVALYEDLKRKCTTYPAASRPVCYSLAWTYYQAVSFFGSLYGIDPEAAVAAAGTVS